MWARAGRLLPRAADLAGSFPAASGPDCFGTVMAAAGVDGAESEWVARDPFEDWLAGHASRVQGTKRDQRPGVVLVWRNRGGLAEHAAVTIGGGYVLSKPSQGWFSPRVVWTVGETIAASRCRGVTLSRYLMAT
jgi:cell wall-associated NlpC family hydrolase